MAPQQSRKVKTMVLELDKPVRSPSTKGSDLRMEKSRKQKYDGQTWALEGAGEAWGLGQKLRLG